MPAPQPIRAEINGADSTGMRSTLTRASHLHVPTSTTCPVRVCPLSSAAHMRSHYRRRLRLISGGVAVFARRSPVGFSDTSSSGAKSSPSVTFNA